mmetsp:Transcript_23142/g.64353  ORF Transcript_23142/g.64353 Transcript_23142/m.64353 type:complete len:94 (-) Transcript_23142:712-993(-)
MRAGLVTGFSEEFGDFLLLRFLPGVRCADNLPLDGPSLTMEIQDQPHCKTAMEKFLRADHLPGTGAVAQKLEKAKSVKLRHQVLLLRFRVRRG